MNYVVLLGLLPLPFYPNYYELRYSMWDYYLTFFAHYFIWVVLFCRQQMPSLWLWSFSSSFFVANFVVIFRIIFAYHLTYFAYDTLLFISLYFSLLVSCAFCFCFSLSSFCYYYYYYCNYYYMVHPHFLWKLFIFEGVCLFDCFGWEC